MSQVKRIPKPHLTHKSCVLIYRGARFTDTGYPPTVYFPCHNHVLIVDL